MPNPIISTEIIGNTESFALPMLNENFYHIFTSLLIILSPLFKYHTISLLKNHGFVVLDDKVLLNKRCLTSMCFP